MRHVKPGFIALIVLLALPGCESVIPEVPIAEVEIEGDKIFIVDQAGKKWDVTYAVRNYDMKLRHFENGLGADAIRPIIDPIMIPPGDPKYPSLDETFLVIGTTFNGDSRAYKITDLNSHEVVDESFGDVHVAVGW